MKYLTFKLIVAASLLFIGNAAYATDVNAPAAKSSDTSAPAASSDTSASAASSGTSAPAEKEVDASKVGVAKLNSGASGRAIGSLLANKAKPANANASEEAKKRVEELEGLAEKQKKLLELYKKQKEQNK